ncbi:hypothetical protein GCM10017581_104240 [Dactylosporangium matsuzakiense]|uniref:Uncharacterized protein n=1 Tax=Dactylosporangium matsuzakiense TaxID=53360 RepID=A0A9W6KV54_9ACTN|nr:hypothetical protein GCM10017581_104240 [Dactylosporangium matsuzakiense]
MPSAQYIDVDSGEIKLHDPQVADDEFQIEQGTITSRGGAKFAPQNGDEACTTVVLGTGKHNVSEGPFCGLSGDKLNPKRFILWFTKFTEAGDCTVNVRYL